jgi:hypothetical protein
VGDLAKGNLVENPELLKGVSIDGNVSVSGDRYYCPTEELSFLLNAHNDLEWTCSEIGQNRCVRVCRFPVHVVRSRTLVKIRLA